ncbi:MAG: efflux RND transporter permease subunit [Bacteroidetes bacterium]|nr:efflux RND transporter permease subunit [Bacteroidota bacterium]
MKLAEFSVKNYQFMLVMFLMVLAIGIYSLFTMPRGEDPEYKAPQFLVTVIYPGTSPADVEDLVVDPIEKRLMELDDMKRVTTDIDDGLAAIFVEYKYSSDPDEKYQELVRELNAIQQTLPEGILPLEIARMTPDRVNILQVALVSETASWNELKKQAEDLEKSLEMVKGLKLVSSWGYPEPQAKVTLNLEKMGSLNIPVSQVMAAIQSENVSIPGGFVDMATRRFNVKTSGKYKSIAELGSTIIRTDGKTVTYLKDIATIGMEDATRSHIVRLNGKRAVLVTAAMKSGENITGVKAAYQPLLESFRDQLPETIAFVHNFDQSESVSERLNRFAIDFGIAILLVSITLLPLGFRAAVVVMISIPLSISIGLTLLYLFGYTINQLSIVGLIVALGILVDDSIVVIENIERWMREGYSRTEAAIKATGQITLAVIGCTAILIVSFLPLMVLPEAAGDFIRSLPMGVVTTVFASLLVALTIVPFLASRILKNHPDPSGNIFMKGLKKVISGSYSVWLDRAVQRPGWTLAIAGMLFAGSLSLIPWVGFSLFPKSERPQFRIEVETPRGTALAETDRVTRDVEAELLKLNEVKYVTSNVGRGNPTIYYNVIPKGESANYAELVIKLTKDTNSDRKTGIIDSLRQVFSLYPNAKIKVFDYEQGPPVDAPVAFRILGDDLDTLRNLARDLETIMRSVPGTIYVNNPVSGQKTDLAIRINYEKAGFLGIPTAEIERTVRLGLAGLSAGTFKTPFDDDTDILLTARKGAEADFTVFNRLTVSSLTGQSYPLNMVATVEMETSPNQIRHYDKVRYVTVSSQVASGFLANDINTILMDTLARFPFPTGYSWNAGGEVESANESFGGIGLIVLFTLFAFIGILILEFGSFRSSLIVLSVIPLGMIGAILALLIFGQPFSFVAVIGFIALAGIEIKNSILLVDFTNQLREQGVPMDQAVREASEKRFVPILLTSMTAIGGLMPLVIEFNPLYSPLALVLIGGLITSTFLSRIVTPVMYKLLPPDIALK